MEYYNARTKVFDDREKRLYEQLSACNKVKHMTETDGWIDIIEPLMKRKIGGLLGEQSSNGIFRKGKVQGAREDEKREYYIGYLNALMDMYNDIVNYVNNIPIKEEAVKDLQHTRTRGTKVPLADGGSYAPTQGKV